MEKKYAAIEKEALAMKWAVDSLGYYFPIVTDHASLQRLHHFKDNPSLLDGTSPYNHIALCYQKSHFHAIRFSWQALSDFLNKRSKLDGVPVNHPLPHGSWEAHPAAQETPAAQWPAQRDRILRKGWMILCCFSSSWNDSGMCPSKAESMPHLSVDTC